MAEGFEGQADFAEYGHGNAVFILKHGFKKVDGLHLGMAVFFSYVDRFLEKLLAFQGEFIQTHGVSFLDEILTDGFRPFLKKNPGRFP
jgi:hypothetical protein